jgi:hypothetical protein
MTGGRRIWLAVLLAAGCHHTQPQAPVPPRPANPTVAPVSFDLPQTQPTPPVLDGRDVPRPAPKTAAIPEALVFRRLTESDCVLLAAANVSAANLLDEENRVPAGRECDRKPQPDELRVSLRSHTALEMRNQAAAAALERFFQLADVEARTDLLRQAFPVVEELLAKARKAKAANVRFPVEPADLELQRSQLVSQLEQAEHGSRLLNLDLKRRLALPYQPETEHLWPAGDLAIDPTPVEAEKAVGTALADRPELRGLRAAYLGLSPDSLPDVRDLLRAASPLLGRGPGAAPPRLLQLLLRRTPPPDPAIPAELEVRRKQLADLIAGRERQVADETRAAALEMNAQVVRVGLARERLQIQEEKLADAVKKRDANQPGAEFLEPQVRADWLKARAEVVAEVAAWHQARVRLRAAQGRFAWEAAPRK